MTRGGPGVAGGELGKDPGGVVHEVGLKAGVLDLLLRQVSGQLVDDGPHHLQVPQLLGADVGQHALELGIGHGVALGEVAQRRAKLSVGAAVLRDNCRGEPWIRVLDLDGVL